MPKNVQTTAQLYSSHPLGNNAQNSQSQASTVCEQYENFQMFKLDLEKAEEPEIKLPTPVGSLKKQVSSRKNIYFCFINYTKTFDCVDHNKLENIKGWEYQTTLPASCETCMQVKKQQLKPDMEQQTGSI